MKYEILEGPKEKTESELIKEGLSESKPLREPWERCPCGETRSTFMGELNDD